uniref:Uncharacterized protein n=1 Tax=Anguilla anguilla TaxID=7936 RepID=A0A0E9QRH0_ANGAN
MEKITALAIVCLEAKYLQNVGCQLEALSLAGYCE